MVNTDGEVIYRHEGVFDVNELDATILAELTEYWDGPQKKKSVK